MEDQSNPKKQQPTHVPVPPEALKEDLGILESYGSFPVWMLKIINLLTPDFLISKTPPKKKKLRI